MKRPVFRPPSDLACAPLPAGGCVLTWYNPSQYVEIRISRDGIWIASIPGDSTGYNDPLAEGGVVRYRVDGVGIDQSATATCEVSLSPLPAVEELSCSAEGFDVSLRWRNPVEYASIEILRDGEGVATVAGTDTSWTVRVSESGTFDYTVRGLSEDGVPSPDAGCDVVVGPPQAPPIENFACTPDGLRVSITWKPPAPGSYESYRLLRDGALLSRLDGNATSHVDLLPETGTYSYTLYGEIEGGSPARTSCTVIVHAPPPVENLECVAQGFDAFLSWTLPESAAYATSVILLDGDSAATLERDATSWSETLTQAGTYRYGVRGTAGSLPPSDTVSCDVTVTPLPPVADLTCRLSDARALLEWSIPQGQTYTSIEIRRNGELLATLPGDAVSHEDTPETEGRSTYEVIARQEGIPNAEPAVCDLERTGGPKLVAVEGSNIVDIVEVSPYNFTCKLATPPLPVPESTWYNDRGDHYHNWFLLKIEDAAGRAVTVTITNADWGGGGDGFWGRDDGQAVWTEAVDPHALAAEDAWQRVTHATYAYPDFAFTVTPATDHAWVALSYPAMPSHTDNWVEAYAPHASVTAEILLRTPGGRPLWMLFVTDPAFPRAQKRGVVLYGQEHMNEQTGGWACQGAVEFLISGDPIAQRLLQNVVFIVIPDMNPDATAAGTNGDPDDGKSPQWRYNPAAIDRLMPGMATPMTDNARAIWNRLVRFVDEGGRVDLCFNLHQGGRANWSGVYELADPKSQNFDGFLRSYMPTSGAPWVPNRRQGYSRGGWVNVPPTGFFAFRLLGRCWEQWRTVPMAYEISVGATADNFLTNARGIKYFGEAIGRSVHEYFGGFLRSINVGTPNGGVSLASGASGTVTWSTTGSISRVRIDCSIDGGASWSNLAARTPNDGSEAVTWPVADSSSCLLRISDASALGVSDISDGPFTIGAPPPGTLTVTSPDGGETWYGNEMATVTWTSTGHVGNVKIDLSADGGFTWRRLAHSVPDNGSYRVNIPGTLSSQCLIRVTGVENDLVTDTSTASFAIQEAPPWPTLTVTSPNGGESWTAGGTAIVTWTATATPMGAVGDVGISLSMDEGASWTTLLTSTPNDGAETVTVPDAASSRCLLWIYDARVDPWLGSPDADPLDVSDEPFSIE